MDHVFNITMTSDLNSGKKKNREKKSGWWFDLKVFFAWVCQIFHHKAFLNFSTACTYVGVLMSCSSLRQSQYWITRCQHTCFYTKIPASQSVGAGASYRSYRPECGVMRANIFLLIIGEFYFFLFIIQTCFRNWALNKFCVVKWFENSKNLSNLAHFYWTLSFPPKNTTGL